MRIHVLSLFANAISLLLLLRDLGDHLCFIVGTMSFYCISPEIIQRGYEVLTLNVLNKGRMLSLS